MSVADAVSAMIKAEPGQSNAIVATDQYQAIIESAIAAGAKPENFVAAALVATDGENADMIIAAAVKAAPNSQDAIVQASVRVLPQTASGVQAIAASPMRATIARSSGDGAAATAQDIENFEEALADIEAALVASGAEVAAAEAALVVAEQALASASGFAPL